MPANTLAHAAARHAKYNPNDDTYLAHAHEFILGECGYPYPDFIQMYGENDRPLVFEKTGKPEARNGGAAYVQYYQSLPPGGPRLLVKARTQEIL